MKRIGFIFSFLLLTNMFSMAQGYLPILRKGLQGTKDAAIKAYQKTLPHIVGNELAYYKISDYYRQYGSNYYHQPNNHEFPKIHITTNDNDRSFGDLLSSVIDYSDMIDLIPSRDSLPSSFHESSLKPQLQHEIYNHNSSRKTLYIHNNNNYPIKMEMLHFLQNSTKLVFKPKNYKLYENQ